MFPAEIYVYLPGDVSQQQAFLFTVGNIYSLGDVGQ